MATGRTWNVTNSFVTTTTNALPALIYSNTTTNGQMIIKTPASTTMQWIGIKFIDFTGSGSTPVANNSFNYGGNTNVTINGPITGGGACIIGGWLLWRDMPEHLNDNFPAWLEKSA